ncbi:hypothetical protein DSUL_90023 [Desulfovibrionales bacterium]
MVELLELFFEPRTARQKSLKTSRANLLRLALVQTLDTSDLLFLYRKRYFFYVRLIRENVKNVSQP